ncbi:glycosyltransferase family 9 protein [Mycolicibacterium sphagni]|uniref:Glycosyltransferase family 9 protein n=1 Tax=Mycolicibacterium sphagni TaxID=1786 RepID=A0ABX2K3B3_9MYCO|nr:glycosyltransferase family 9 protein [Mycolicibacterium sphagni]NTY62222.1 glycosyltransferase family 9 protein [Mycolicibacterium sphagni]
MTDSEVVRARFRRRYENQSRVFSLLDRTLEFFFGKARIAHSSSLPAPRKLLICNHGQVGDMVITLSLLPALKRAFPDVELGLLCGSWNRQLVEKDPLLDHIHYLDHWNQVRNSASRARNIATYLRALMRTLRELKAVRYDTAIDNRVWFPNGILELWLARIPIRVGYDFVGFTPLLTHAVKFEFDQWRHEREYQAAPLACLPIDRSMLDEVPERWIESDGNGFEIVAQHRQGALPSRYVVLHPGASTEVKNWTEDGWAEIARRAISAGALPVLTGLGTEQDALTARIVAEVPGALSLSSKVSWQQLVALISDAHTVYCVDTSVGHLASAVGVPCVVIYGGMELYAQWKPVGSRVAIVRQDLPCSPCFQKTGCEHMSCLRSITAEQVWHANG